jgi:hypothetical protein
MQDEQVPPAPGYPGYPGSAWQPSEGLPWPPPNPAAWPPPPSPPAKRSRARAVVTGAIVALAAALISGSGGYELGVHHSQVNAAMQNLNAVASGPCAAGETQPAPSATSPAGTALLARLLPIPRGDTRVTSLKQGVLSLHDYLDELYSGNSAEQAHLTARCFQTAVHRTWQTPAGTTVSVWLIQFGTGADARSYTLAGEQGDSAAASAHTARFTVAGVADSAGFADPTLDQYGNTFTRALGDTGNTSIIIHVYVPGETGSAVASQVLQAQNARLIAGAP